MSEHLFVYGTLMDQVDSAMARFLKSNGTLLGEAWLAGRLYDLGQYPGAVYDAAATSRVYGHVFQLHQASEVFAVLDVYEGIDPTQTLQNEYRRALLPVDFQCRTLACWVYLYNLSPEGLPAIPSGNYLDYIQNNNAHLRFIKGGR